MSCYPATSETLFDEYDTSVAFTSTDGNGAYSFTGLALGDYSVVFDYTSTDAQVHFAPADQGSDSTDSDVTTDLGSDDYHAYGQTDTISLTASEVKDDVDAGIWVDPLDAVISGVAWIDANDDGIRSSEEMLSGVSVTLRDDQDMWVNSTTTDSNGAYSFTNLALGSYYVVFDYSSMYAQVDFAPADQGSDSTDSDVTTDLGSNDYRAYGKTDSFTLAASEPLSNLDAGIWVDPLDAVISGVAWIDANDDGIRNSEEMLSGVYVTHHNDQDMSVASTTTDGNEDTPLRSFGEGHRKYKVDSRTILRHPLLLA